MDFGDRTLWRFEGHEYDDEGNAYQEYLFLCDERYTSGEQIREAILDLFRAKLRGMTANEAHKLTWSRDTWYASEIFYEAGIVSELGAIGIEPFDLASEYAGEWDDFHVSIDDEELTDLAARWDAEEQAA